MRKKRGKKGETKTLELACRQALLERGGEAAAGKY